MDCFTLGLFGEDDAEADDRALDLSKTGSR